MALSPPPGYASGPDMLISVFLWNVLGTHYGPVRQEKFTTELCRYFP